MCAFVETWWGCAGMCWPMIWTTSSDLDRLITVPSWEFFPWNSLNSPLWCVFDSSAVVALVHLFEERIHVGQGYAPPPRVTWSIESISFRWGDIFAWKKMWFSGKRHWILQDLTIFSIAQEQRGVKGHKKVWKSSVNWMGEEKYGSGSSVVSEDSHGFFCSKRIHKTFQIREQKMSSNWHQKWRLQRPTPIASLWFWMISLRANDEERPAFTSFWGLEWHHEAEATIWAHSRGRGLLTSFVNEKNITKSYEHVKLQSPQKTSDVRDPNQGFCLEFLPSIPVGSTAEADVKSFRHSVAWGYREAL